MTVVSGVRANRLICAFEASSPKEAVNRCVAIVRIDPVLSGL